MNRFIDTHGNRLLRWAGASWLLCFVLAARGETAVTLEQSFDFALRQNRALRLVELSVDSRQIQVDQARSVFKPVFRPQVGTEASEAGDTVRYGLSVADQTTWGTKLQARGESSRLATDSGSDLYTDGVHLELQQPLLRRLGPLVNREPITQAESGVAAARRDAELRKTDLVVQVAETYAQLLRLQRQRVFEQQTVDRLQPFVKLTRAREQQGRASRLDSLRAEVKLGDAQLRLKAAADDLKSVRADFAELLGFPPDVECTAAESLSLSVNVVDVPVAVGLALSNRLDYAQLLQDEEDRRRGVRIARQQMLPDLTMISRYDVLGSGESSGDAGRLDDHVWFVGLAVQSDIPDRPAVSGFQQAKVAQQVAELQVETVKAAIARQVQQAVSAYRRAQEELPLTERNYQLALNRVKLSRRLFEMGRTTGDTVADAEEEYQRAQEQWLQVQSTASVEAYRLLRVLGSLVEAPADLKPRWES